MGEIRYLVPAYLTTFDVDVGHAIVSKLLPLGWEKIFKGFKLVKV